MKTPLAQGCREHSRHAPKAMGAHASIAVAWGWLRELGAQGCQGVTRGDRFSCSCPAASSRLHSRHCREGSSPGCSGAEGHGTLCPCSQSSGPWCPAKGSRSSLSNGGICRKICRIAGEWRPLERGPCGERGNSARVHVRGHPRYANMPLQLSGTRHLRRSRLAL